MSIPPPMIPPHLITEAVMMTFEEASNTTECPKCGYDGSAAGGDNTFAVEYEQDTMDGEGHLNWSCYRCYYTFRSRTKDDLP